MTATCLFGPLFKHSQGSSVSSNRSKLQFIADKYMTKWDDQYIKAYNHKWELLMKSMTTSTRDAIWAIRFAEIPWPISPTLAKETPDPLIITCANITRFLICPYRDDRHSCLEKVLNELDRWDDFELMVAISRHVCRADKKKVQEAWSRVVLILMEMRGDYSSCSNLAPSDV